MGRPKNLPSPPAHSLLLATDELLRAQNGSFLVWPSRYGCGPFYGDEEYLQKSQYKTLRATEEGVSLRTLRNEIVMVSFNFTWN